MRIATLPAVIAMALLADFANAASQQDIKNCVQTADPDRLIAGCTQVLRSPNIKGQNRATILAQRGTGYWLKFDYDQAIAQCDEALRIDPKSVAALNVRAFAWFRKGEIDKSLADSNAAIQLAPKSAAPLNARAQAWEELGEHDKAFADYNEAIRLEPKQSVSYNNRGLAWIARGDYDLALADFDQAVRLDPRSEKSHANRGEAWRLKGDLDKAIGDQTAEIRIFPNRTLGYIRRGDSYRYKGDLERALADYSKALTMEPDYIPAFAGRGLTYEKMGDIPRARAEFEKVLASRHQFRVDIARSGLETARARLAAFDSGAVQPTIPAAPSKVTSMTVIPTPAAAIPSAALKAPAGSGRRVALVIGNSSYKNVPALSNPQRDAEAIATSLRAVGFELVTIANNSTRENLIDALRTFGDEAEKADWAMVYYAGHGIEVNGMNYLIPVDAKLAADRDVQFEAVPLDQVMASVEGAKKLKLIMLDACRDNPFAPQMRRTAAPDAVAAVRSTAGGTVGTRSIGRGLGEVKVSGATLVVYAAKHGQTALDGEGGNSPFAVAVVQRIATPNVEINKLFRLVRDDVMEATAGRQEPYTYGSLPGKEDFFFVGK